ncbi:MAG: TetR/AcrR family transcriptional regulator [Nitrospiraceae bacterium]|jgi:TetR/AcrR family transcriptional regulator, fatty acid metabolism regulator protein|nr:MAG: TetR/AcrR family transcriptional regulator [Nitrospiraceae bacterium]
MLKGTAKVSTDIRRDQIAQAALRIIAGKGVRGLTVSAIAEEVGISEANIYRHFSSKDEILSFTVEKVGRGLKRNIENVLKMGSAASPLVKLKRAFMLHLDYIEKNEGVPRLVFSDEMHLGNEELKKKLLQSIASYSATLESFVKAGQKAGIIEADINPKATAVLFIGMVQAATLRWSLNNFSFSLVTEGTKLWENFEKCIRTH